MNVGVDLSSMKHNEYESSTSMFLSTIKQSIRGHNPLPHVLSTTRIPKIGLTPPRSPNCKLHEEVNFRSLSISKKRIVVI
jgi:hypothetical protein